MRSLTIPVLLLLTVCLCMLSYNMSAPHDIWWQLANGKIIAETGELVSADPYTFTIQGERYDDKYWLYELLTYKIHSAAGWDGLELLKAFLVLSAMFSLLMSVKRNPPWLLILLAIPAILLIDLRILLRAYWFTLIIFPLSLRLLTTIITEEKYSYRNVIVLIISQVAWANLHGEFFWAWLAATLISIEKIIQAIKARQLSIKTLRPIAITALLVASSACNPLGFKLITGLITEAQRLGAGNLPTEWLPLISVVGPLTIISWFTLLTMTITALWMSRKHTSFSLVTLFVIFAVLSQYSMRFLGVFIIISIFVAMEKSEKINLPASVSKHLLTSSAIINIMSLMAIIWSVALGQFYYAQREMKLFGSGVITSEFPQKASEFIKHHHLTGNFINSWTQGGYIIWHNWPDIKIAADGRTAPFPPELSSELEKVTQGDMEAFRQFSEKYKPQGAIVPWQYTGMIYLLAARGDWELLFIGPNASVWMETSALLAQKKKHLVIPDKDISSFIVSSEEESLKQNSFISFAEHANRRALVFNALGHTDLANKQISLIHKD